MVLEIKHLTKKYDNQVLFSNLTIQFPETGLVGIVGESGCGKSTLLNILSGLDTDYQGDVIIDGKTLKTMVDIGQYRKDYISFVYQNYRLFDYMDVYHNCLVYCWIKGIQYHKTNLDRLFEVFELTELKHKKVNCLSGGQKQRVAFIRAVLCQSPILFLDEPTASLNDENKKLIFQYLIKYSLKHLVVVVSHDQKLLQSMTSHIIDFNHLKEEYLFKVNHFAYYYPCLHKSKSLLYYLIKTLNHQKKKLLMILLSQVFMVIATTYMITGLNGMNQHYYQNYVQSINHNLVVITKINHEIISLQERKQFHYLPSLFLEAGSISQLPTFQSEPIQGLKKNQIMINQAVAKKGFKKGKKLIYYYQGINYHWTIKEIKDDHLKIPVIYYSPNSMPADLKKLLLNQYQCFYYPKDASTYIKKLPDHYQGFCLALQEYKSYQEMLNLFKIVSEIFIAISLLIAVVLILLIVLAILYEQESEFAMLQANGLTNKEMYKLLFKEIAGLMIVNGIFSCILMTISTTFARIFHLSSLLFKIDHMFVFPVIFYNQNDLYVICFLMYIMIGLIVYVISALNLRKTDMIQILKEE